MSHSKERKEKICLNCGAATHGRYCHVCGQENIETKETFWHLVTHFVYDITHFDGKFFSTLKYLLFRPGYLSSEYLKGKRASYLNPIKMYVFTSAIFFLIIFATNHADTDDVEASTNTKQEAIAAAKKKVSKLRRKTEIYAEVTDSLEVDNKEVKAILQHLEQDSIMLLDSAVVIDSLWHVQERKREKNDMPSVFGSKKYASIEMYKKSQDSLSKDQQDGWFVRTITTRLLEMGNKYNNNWQVVKEKIAEKFFHSIPKLMFVALPLVALLFQLFYKSKSNYYYMHHGIFTVHLFITILILILVTKSLLWLKAALHFKLFSYLALGFILYIFIYVYKAMRKFYMQGRGKTILKYILLSFLFFWLFILIVIAGFAISALQA